MFCSMHPIADENFAYLGAALLPHVCRPAVDAAHPACGFWLMTPLGWGWRPCHPSALGCCYCGSAADGLALQVNTAGGRRFASSSVAQKSPTAPLVHQAQPVTAMQASSVAVPSQPFASARPSTCSRC
jgi:hypothetical protein